MNSLRKWKSICELQFCLGRLSEKTSYNDKLANSKEYKDIDKSKSVEPKLWLKNCNKIALSFLEGATNIYLNHENEKENNALIHTVEKYIIQEI